MATGGEEFGDERTPILQQTDDQDDGDATGGNETTGFEPGDSSTPAPNGNQRQTTMNRPGEQPSFDLPDTPDLSTTNFAKNALLQEFPDFDKNNIKYRLNTEKNDRLEVGIAKVKKPFYPLLTKIAGKDEYRINPQLPKEILRALGKGRRETLEEEIKSLTDGINDNKAMAEDSSQSETEINQARERAKFQIEKRADLQRQLDKLKKGDLSLPSESIDLEDFKNNERKREERQQQIQSKREENDEIMNDKNSSPEEKEHARQNNQELENEQNDIENQRQRDLENLPLRDRLREKVKAIFKKYGFTVGAVFLAVGTTLGVVLSSLSNGLKEVSRGVGNGLRTLGKKIAEILPGLIGAVVSFVFRTAGNVIGFLGKHAWLLILAVAALLFERVMKRRG